MGPVGMDDPNASGPGSTDRTLYINLHAIEDSLFFASGLGQDASIPQVSVLVDVKNIYVILAPITLGFKGNCIIAED